MVDGVDPDGIRSRTPADVINFSYCSCVCARVRQLPLGGGFFIF